MLKSAIFDLDGVIVDSHPAHTESWRRLLLKLGKTPTDKQFEIVREGRRKAEILRYFLGELSDQEVQEYGDQKDVFFWEECQNLRTVDGLERLLEELGNHGISAAVASSGSRTRVHGILEFLGLKKCFVTVVSGDDVLSGKPHPEMFNKTAAQMAVRPEDSLVFEDSVCGVQAANAAGMKCVGISEGKRADALLAAGASEVRLNFLGLSLDDLQKLF
jgi:HAD superfamily hydrolase (TIGR01509 family)